MSIKTYIDKNKFQFITDFSKKTIKIEDKIIEVDFGALSIPERIVLSAYLTVLMNDDKASKQNLYDIIFNFNNSKRYSNSSNYHDKFIDDVTEILKNKLYFMAFIKENFNKIEDNKTVIYRQQLNSTEMNVLYSMKFQRSYKHLMYVLYIMGVSKQNIPTRQLNKIDLKSFYPTSSTLGKRRIEDIFNKLSQSCGRTIEHTIDNNIVWFKNGFGIEEDELNYSEDKKQYINNKKIDDWFNESIEVKKPEVKQTIEVEKITPINYNSNINSSIDLGEEGRLSWNMLTSYREDYDNQTKITNGKLNPENKIKFSAIANKINNFIEKDKNVKLLYWGGRFEGPDWQKKKDLANINLNNLKNSLCKDFEKIYDENKESYFNIIDTVCRAFPKLFK